MAAELVTGFTCACGVWLPFPSSSLPVTCTGCGEIYDRLACGLEIPCEGCRVAVTSDPSGLCTDCLADIMSEQPGSCTDDQAAALAAAFAQAGIDTVSGRCLWLQQYVPGWRFSDIAQVNCTFCQAFPACQLSQRQAGDVLEQLAGAALSMEARGL